MIALQDADIHPWTCREHRGGTAASPSRRHSLLCKPTHPRSRSWCKGGGKSVTQSKHLSTTQTSNHASIEASEPRPVTSAIVPLLCRVRSGGEFLGVYQPTVWVDRVRDMFWRTCPLIHTGTKRVKRKIIDFQRMSVERGTVNEAMASDQEPFLLLEDKPWESESAHLRSSQPERLTIPRAWRSSVLVHLVLVAIYTFVTIAIIRFHTSVVLLPSRKQ